MLFHSFLRTGKAESVVSTPSHGLKVSFASDFSFQIQNSHWQSRVSWALHPAKTAMISLHLTARVSDRLHCEIFGGWMCFLFTMYSFSNISDCVFMLLSQFCEHLLKPRVLFSFFRKATLILVVKLDSFSAPYILAISTLHNRPLFSWHISLHWKELACPQGMVWCHMGYQPSCETRAAWRSGSPWAEPCLQHCCRSGICLFWATLVSSSCTSTVWL